MDTRGIFYQEGGTIQGFETPIRILGILKKASALWGLGGSFFTPEGVRGIPRVFPTKRVGQSKVLKPLLEF